MRFTAALLVLALATLSSACVVRTRTRPVHHQQVGHPASHRHEHCHHRGGKHHKRMCHSHPHGPGHH
ncbi:MAG: hypothetical protein KBG48_23105 [Kofleriaceae bacterium]|jgi:hypothetical protein|nr:hypothetical protein [Kofleriaceae bacterium]MBP9170313.1 hypothetical protein [Kofleriaceae bacterium]MBP9860032.1 hypothetical protein [Kofleriaceae bacterium]